MFSFLDTVYIICLLVVYVVLDDVHVLAWVCVCVLLDCLKHCKYTMMLLWTNLVEWNVSFLTSMTDWFVFVIIIIIIISAKWTKWMAEIMRSFDVCLFVCAFVCAQRPVMGVKC